MNITRRWTIAIIAVIAIGMALFVGGIALGRTGWRMFGYGPSMMDGNFGFGMMNGFGGIIPVILTILFWVAIIALAGWLISSLVSRANSQPPAELLLDILKKRYARGEITKEQFDEMRRDLNV